MIHSSRTSPWQFSLAQLVFVVTLIALILGVLVSDAPFAVKAPLLCAAMIAASAAVWMLGNKMTSARSLWIQAMGELVTSIAFAVAFLFVMYECIAISYLAAYLSIL